MICGIYKITNIKNNRVYIGRSIHIEYRWQQHQREAFNEKSPAYNYSIHQAFRKYGISAFKFEIIEECSEELLNEREIYWIDYFNSYKDGYNETTGGDCGPRMIGEDNPRAKLTEKDVFDIRSNALQCKSQSEIYYQFYADKISFSQFAKIWRGEGWENILPETADFVKSSEYISTVKSNAAKQKITQEQKDYWADIEKRKINGENRLEVYELYKDYYSLGGFNKIWYKTKEGVKPFKKAVAQLDLKTEEIIKIYESAAEAGKQTNCDSSGISKVCRGKRASCGGFKWRFYE